MASPSSSVAGEWIKRVKAALNAVAHQTARSNEPAWTSFLVTCVCVCGIYVCMLAYIHMHRASADARREDMTARAKEKKKEEERTFRRMRGGRR